MPGGEFRGLPNANVYSVTTGHDLQVFTNPLEIV
jgi:hypothetical protein